MIKINVLFDGITCECFHILQCLREIVKSDFVIAILANSDSQINRLHAYIFLIYSVRWNNVDDDVIWNNIDDDDVVTWAEIMLCLSHPKATHKKVHCHCPLFCLAWFLGQSVRRLWPLMGPLQTVQFLVLPPLDDCAAVASCARTTDTVTKIWQYVSKPLVIIIIAIYYYFKVIFLRRKITCRDRRLGLYVVAAPRYPSAYL